MTNLAFEKSKKSFGPNLSRRKFFGFSLSAAAAVVAVPLVEEVYAQFSESKHVLYPHQVQAVEDLMRYCETEYRIGDWDYGMSRRLGRKLYGESNWKTDRQLTKQRMWGAMYGMGYDKERKLFKHPALGMGYA